MNEEFSTNTLVLKGKNKKKKYDDDGKVKKVKWVAKLKGDDPDMTLKVKADSEDELKDTLGEKNKSVDIVLGSNQTSLDDHAE